jgi:environmental stress-induced protein Ves
MGAGTKLLGRDRLWLYNRMRARQCQHMTPHCVLSPTDYRRMPWKNGGGHTTEIAAHPAGSGFASFVWRVSVADVLQDGPFSPFAGVDRTLVLLAGAGVRLTGDGEPLELRTTFEPVSFSGDPALHCSLVAGPVRDFNLMVRRGAARGSVVVRREGGESIAPADTYVCYAAVGSSECLVAGHPPISLAEAHTLLVTPEAGTPAHGLSVNPLAAGSVALVAAIRFTSVEGPPRDASAPLGGSERSERGGPSMIARAAVRRRRAC